MNRIAARLALIGHPVAHSLSPRIFEILGRGLRRRVEYRLVDVPRGSLKAAFPALAGAFRGVNVTIPHKESVARFCDRLTPQARRVGAVNVVGFSRGRAIGHNTDVLGFLDALAGQGIKTRGLSAVIFGAGGAARAAGVALGGAGARWVRFVNRTPSRARGLARELGEDFPWTGFFAGVAAPADLWINATPLGLPGFPRRSPAPDRAACGLAFDMVYGKSTPFLLRARTSGAAAIDGLAMLTAQAVRAWEFWFGSLGKRRAPLARRLLEELQ